MRKLKSVVKAGAFVLAILSPTQMMHSQNNQKASSHKPKIQQETQTDCLADAIYYEAGHESLLGKAAVGRVVINRVNHRFSDSVCGVVNQGAANHACQFKFRCGPQKPPQKAIYAECRTLAGKLLTENQYANAVPASALFFHADSVHPSWPHYRPVGHIGHHIFYAEKGAIG